MFRSLIIFALVLAEGLVTLAGPASWLQSRPLRDRELPAATSIASSEAGELRPGSRPLDDSRADLRLLEQSGGRRFSAADEPLRLLTGFDAVVELDAPASHGAVWKFASMLTRTIASSRNRPLLL